MNVHDDFSWFRLTRLRGVGVKGLWAIYNYTNRTHISISDLITDPNHCVPGTSKGQKLKVGALLTQQDFEAVTAEYELLTNQRVKVLHPHHHAFPQRVIQYGQKFDIPPVLFTRGYVPLMQANNISIVGSRDVDHDGLELASTLARGLARKGINVVSGYAKGVDSCAHYNSLEAEGTTTIVLSLGILNFEAKKNLKPLFTSSNTLVVSQFQPKEKWLARNAMARNRLVCALSDALVVIASGPEYDSSGKMSGTFDAAKNALAMGIPVFVASPDHFAKPPQGNADLIRLGCNELTPENEINQIAAVMQAGAGVAISSSSSDSKEEQLSLETVL